MGNIDRFKTSLGTKFLTTGQLPNGLPPGYTQMLCVHPQFPKHGESSNFNLTALIRIIFEKHLQLSLAQTNTLASEDFMFEKRAIENCPAEGWSNIV